MPTYDYECDACGHEMELFQKITDDPIKKCPQCKKNKLRRLFGTGAAVVFKGSGFYQTDYRSDSYKKGEKAESKPKDSGSKSETKSDSKSKTGSGDSKPKTSESKSTSSGNSASKKTSD